MPLAHGLREADPLRAQRLPSPAAHPFRASRPPWKESETMLSNPILIVLLVVGVGALAGGAGYGVAVRRARKRTQEAKGEADQIVAQARPRPRAS